MLRILVLLICSLAIVATTQAQTVPSDVLDSIRNDKMPMGNVVPVNGNLTVKNQIVKAEEIVFQSGAHLIWATTGSLTGVPWIAVVAKRIKFVDPATKNEMSTWRPKLSSWQWPQLENATTCRANPCWPVYYVCENRPPKPKRASKGEDGTPGTSGRDGFGMYDYPTSPMMPPCGVYLRPPGANSPKLYIIVGEIQNQEGAPYPKAENLKFDLRGQDGPDGVDGLDGQPGGEGGEGGNGVSGLGCDKSPGKGGRGGDGGAAGWGTNGRNGGNSGGIAIVGPNVVINSLTYSEILVEGGKGGKPGQHGTPGEGGRPGARGESPGFCTAPAPANFGEGLQGAPQTIPLQAGYDGFRGPVDKIEVSANFIEQLFQ